MHKHFFFYVALSWTLLMLYVCLINSSEVPTINIIGIDKIVHIILHLLFTFFWGITLVKSGKWSSFSKVMFVSFLLSFVFGLLIEFLQGNFTTSRSADLTDVLANNFGALFAIALLCRYKEKLAT
ncbi:VanZ family protein [Flavobacterium sp. RSSA_27]|uniref:VanZ family protein n=1 Tax=Flavobacterium sp. RSSA_27 TaxID=3447667 RepID=UPI003F39A2B9